MAAEDAVIFGTYTVRTDRVYKSNADSITIDLGIGGSISLSYLEDVEEHVGEIESGNEVTITERDNRYGIKITRKRHVCDVGGCSTTAESKFDGTWLCESHLNSYTARNI